MSLFRSRSDTRRWSRRLVDEETRDFVDGVLEESSEMFRTASGEFQMRGLCLYVFEGARTRELRWLKQRGTDPEEFYRRELAPSWEGLDRAERAAKVEQLIELSKLLGDGEARDDPPEAFLDILATVHVKVLLLAWAHDRSYSFIDRIFNGPLQYPVRRYRLAGGRLKVRVDDRREVC
ncbi:MAG: hypothetical protein NVSMB25_12850 [Thermoleophilaceae bacterium]